MEKQEEYAELVNFSFHHDIIKPSFQGFGRCLNYSDSFGLSIYWNYPMYRGDKKEYIEAYDYIIDDLKSQKNIVKDLIETVEYDQMDDESEDYFAEVEGGLFGITLSLGLHIDKPIKDMIKEYKHIFNAKYLIGLVEEEKKKEINR
tara:strand:+ start:66 stop:503 length:438 start_codon:yes stop_codon:yes gene_type:complete